MVLNRKNKKNIMRHKFEVIILVLIVAFITSLIISKMNSSPSKLSNFSEDDIISETPITVSHEMTESEFTSIPFYPQDGPQPKISVSETKYDFGRIGANEIVSHDFYIKNIGDAPLTISRAYTTCGCTQAKLSSTNIPPGKIILVTIIFDAGYHDSRGQIINRGLIIENNDPVIPQLEIWTQASVLNN